MPIKRRTQATLNVFGFDLFVLAFSLFLKVKIEQFIHYRRMRGIVYVLEIADFATRNGYKLCQEDFLKKSTIPGIQECRPGDAPHA